MILSSFGNNNNNQNRYNNNSNRSNNSRQHSFHNRSFDAEKKEFPTKQFTTTELTNKLGDKLIGMMTDKEKNWVVNVQMLQLQIDDPYCYDFYYTVFKLILTLIFCHFSI
jgi:DNA topoisomerase 2-associated protein PAT1